MVQDNDYLLVLCVQWIISTSNECPLDSYHWLVLSVHWTITASTECPMDRINWVDNLNYVRVGIMDQGTRVESPSGSQPLGISVLDADPLWSVSPVTPGLN